MNREDEKRWANANRGEHLYAIPVMYIDMLVDMIETGERDDALIENAREWVHFTRNAGIYALARVYVSSLVKEVE